MRPGRGALLWLAGAFVLAGLFASTLVSDPDAWIHLAGGRLILEERSLPSVNTFSWTAGDHPWKNPEWLFDLILALSYGAAGYLGISFLQFLLVGGAFALAVDAARRRMGGALRGRDLLLLLPPLLLGLSASSFRFVPRPELVTFFGLGLLAALWEREAAGGGRGIGFFVSLALTGLVWGNAHPGVAFGLGACLAFTAGEAFRAARSGGAEGRRPGLARAALGTGAFFLGSLANPYLLYPYLYSFEHLSIGRVVTLVEFTPPSPGRDTAFFAFAALAVGSAAWRARKGEWRDLLAAAGLLPLVFYTARTIPLFVLWALPGTALTLREALDALPAGVLRRAALGALLAAGAVLAARQELLLPHRSPFGWGLHSSLVPSGAAETVLAKGMEGRIYNDYGQGGYLMWRLFPAQKIFLDGRTFAYPREFLSEVASFRPSYWPTLLAKYRIDIALIPRGPHDGGAFVGGMFDVMGWRLAYFDGVSLLYVRPKSPDAGKVGKDGFSLIRPWTSPEELVRLAESEPGELLAELRRVDPARILRPDEAGRFGPAAYEAGDLPLAERFFRAGLRLAPRSPGLRFGLGATLEKAGFREEARREFRRVLEEGREGYWSRQAEERLAGLGR